jgi:hypothetical protein
MRAITITSGQPSGYVVRYTNRAGRAFSKYSTDAGEAAAHAINATREMQGSYEIVGLGSVLNKIPEQLRRKP